MIKKKNETQTHMEHFFFFFSHFRYIFCEWMRKYDDIWYVMRFDLELRVSVRAVLNYWLHLPYGTRSIPMCPVDFVSANGETNKSIAFVRITILKYPNFEVFDRIYAIFLLSISFRESK